VLHSVSKCTSKLRTEMPAAATNVPQGHVSETVTCHFAGQETVTATDWSLFANHV